MSCNQSAKNVGEKRPLQYQNEEAVFVVSQQDQNDDCGGTNTNKRQRTAEPESPGVVSITSAAAAMDFHFNDMSVNDSKPWWKQKPVATRAPMMLDTTPTCCFICRRPHHPKQPESCGNMPCNSLLSYFPTTATKVASTGTMTPAAMDTKPAATTTDKDVVLFQKCTFCDRAACPSCTRQCEACHFHFCSLCSIANYSGPYERSYCLDCNNTANAARREHDSTDMNIG